MLRMDTKTETKMIVIISTISIIVVTMTSTEQMVKCSISDTLQTQMDTRLPIQERKCNYNYFRHKIGGREKYKNRRKITEIHNTINSLAKIA